VGLYKLILIALIFVSPALYAGDVASDGFVNKFEISEPIYTAEADRFEQNFLAGEKALSWKTVESQTNIVDINNILNIINLNNTSVYVKIAVASSKNKKVIITVGSDDGMKLYLNKKLIKSVNQSRNCILDDDIIKTDFTTGNNEILLRVDNIDGEYKFCLRIAQTKDQMAQVSYTLQPNRDRLQKSQLVNDSAFMYFNQKPKDRWNGPAKIKNIIMSGMHKEAHEFYKIYFDNSMMPQPDVLELRAPIYSLYDSNSHKKSEHIMNAIKKAYGDKVPEIEVSLLVSFFSAYKSNPEVAENITEFYKKWYDGKAPEFMVDSQGNSVSTLKNSPDRFYYSYYDPKNIEFITTMVKESMQYLVEDNKFRINAFHFRFPGNNDWYYPIDNGFYDYSISAQDAFRSYLKNKYHTLDKMNTIYGKSYQTLDEIIAPKPVFNEFNASKIWQDWQEFRCDTVINAQKQILNSAKSVSPDSTFVSWMTTAIFTASRDGIVLDKAMKLGQEYNNLLMTLTCFDYFDLPGEIFGQLSLAYNVPISIEPLHNDPESYQKTYFNVLRFSPKKVNWLFHIARNPDSTPWIKWVLNQRSVTDELSEATLIQSETAQLISYSDMLYQVPDKLWNSQILKSQLELFRSLQASNINLAMITDFSLDIDLSKYKSLVIADLKSINQKMILKITSFVRNGGKVLIIGDTGRINLSSEQSDYPLLQALGIQPDKIRSDKNGIKLLKIPEGGDILIGDANNTNLVNWPCAKGEVFFYGKGSASTIGSDGRINSDGQKILNRIDVIPLLEVKDNICPSFIKKNKNIYYVGFINSSGGSLNSTVVFNFLRNKKGLEAVEMISGQIHNIIAGKLDLTFEIPWQIKVFKFSL